MNRPTIDVDDLVEMANEAIAEGDFSQAVTILRKATNVAPLRRDIRNRLAVALERTPVPRKASQEPVNSGFDHDDPGLLYADEMVDIIEPQVQEDGAGREAISLVVKKAFDAAAGQTVRAGVATKQLTNLLHSGIQSWKSSLADQVKFSKPIPLSAGKAAMDPMLQVSDATQAEVFDHETDLDEYLNRTNLTPGRPIEEITPEELELTQSEATIPSRGTSPASAIKKTTRSASNKKTGTRQTDVEDVLAAGIDSFIEAVSQANKRKIAFGIVYVALGGLFSYACFDVSKKFPAVEAIPGREISSASLGNLNLSEVSTNNEAIDQAKKLSADGQISEAITILKTQLESGVFLKNRDQIRVELATILNTQAETHLTNNRMKDSVSSYREALKILPKDAALQLRLANALYYLGTLGDSDEAGKKTALSDAENILSALATKAGDNLQAHRLLGLVREAQGDRSLARVSWEKVKALAPKNSAESKEAASHLK